MFDLHKGITSLVLASMPFIDGRNSSLQIHIIHMVAKGTVW